MGTDLFAPDEPETWHEARETFSDLRRVSYGYDPVVVLHPLQYGTDEAFLEELRGHEDAIDAQYDEVNTLFEALSRARDEVPSSLPAYDDMETERFDRFRDTMADELAVTLDAVIEPEVTHEPDTLIVEEKSSKGGRFCGKEDGNYVIRICAEDQSHNGIEMPDDLYEKARRVPCRDEGPKPGIGDAIPNYAPYPFSFTLMHELAHYVTAVGADVLMVADEEEPPEEYGPCFHDHSYFNRMLEKGANELLSLTLDRLIEEEPPAPLTRDAVDSLQKANRLYLDIIERYMPENTDYVQQFPIEGTASAIQDWYRFQ